VQQSPPFLSAAPDKGIADIAGWGGFFPFFQFRFLGRQPEHGTMATKRTKI